MTMREPESPPVLNVPSVMTIWLVKRAVPPGYPTSMTALIPEIVPWVWPVVRPYFWTFMPREASTVLDRGVP